jgi:hypothetical protein
MPYIDPKLRKRLDGPIEALIVEMNDSAGEPTVVPGMLDYVLTTITLAAVKTYSGGLCYNAIAMVRGVLGNVTDEFYRRVAGPYEDKQMETNGDVARYEKIA